MLFVKKKEELLRPWINYQKLDEKTIRNQYSLPLITEILNQLSKVKYISKINIYNTYSIIRVEDEVMRKTFIQC
jgi:hypothetical protein